MIAATESIHQKKSLLKYSVLIIEIKLPTKSVELKEMHPLEQSASAFSVLLSSIFAALSFQIQRKYINVRERNEITSPGTAVSGYLFVASL